LRRKPALGEIMSGQNRLKKDGVRKEKKTQARKRDFEQPVVGAVSPQKGQDTSNFTDREIAGPDRKENQRRQE
jgi:hypothetical protein